MKIRIQNMVSERCILFVKSELIKMGIHYKSIDLGEVELKKPINRQMKKTLNAKLHEAGLDILHHKNEILVEDIINIVIKMVHHSEVLPNVNFSVFLSEKMHRDYHKMAEIFSKAKGITLEHFVILQKIEKVKELIVYDRLNLSEISYKMHYSSVAHLSRQFKQITGMTPSFYKAQSKIKRKNLHDI